MSLRSWKLCLGLTVLFLGGVVTGRTITTLFSTEKKEAESSVQSSYAGQEQREIVSLSADDISGLKEGRGYPFNGMAKLAELNGYPGPVHILELKGDLGLTAQQREQIEAAYEEMKEQAIPLGEQIVTQEKALDRAFKQGTISQEQLEKGLKKSADLYGELRFHHLSYHLAMMDILATDQVTAYNKFRGYDGLADPCDQVPEGHDPEMRKRHQNCD